MKKQILSFLFVLSAVLLISTSAYAQVDNFNPAPGQTVTYDVTAITGASYQWHIFEKGTSTEAISAYTGSLGTASSISIKWTAASAGNSYDIWVQATDDKGCLTDPLIQEVKVTSPIICIAKASDGTINGVVTAVPSNLNLCSLISGGETGYNPSGSYGDETSFFVKISNGVPNLSTTGSSYIINYQVSDGPTTTTKSTPANLFTDSSGAGALEITISAIDYPTIFESLMGPKTVTITILSITYSGETIAQTCSAPDNAYTVTVQKKPVINF